MFSSVFDGIYHDEFIAFFSFCIRLFCRDLNVENEPPTSRSSSSQSTTTKSVKMSSLNRDANQPIASSSYNNNNNKSSASKMGIASTSGAMNRNIATVATTANEAGLAMGLFGWRKKCLYALILGLIILVVINLSLTLWILKVMEFSTVSLIHIFPQFLETKTLLFCNCIGRNGSIENCSRRLAINRSSIVP